ncbi:AraC family transcriptional regulator [Shewanella putrefaciens]|uniref:AraC family transcriptional regulator n=1 Tax=Shewanella putrefaciens TaxID=24 RepID=UPI0018E8CB8A|nr:AraC family transcriptional regulator [Shewanella putrefaciens]
MAILAPVTTLTNYVEVAKHVGLNPQHMLAQVGLTMAMIENPEKQVPAKAVVDLLELSAAQSGCQNFGLRMAESRRLSDFGVVSLLLSHQATLRDALNVIIEYRHLMNEALAIYIEEEGKTVIIREEIVTERNDPCPQAIDLAIGIMYRFCSALLGSHFELQTVCFCHEAPNDIQLHRRLFKNKIEFGCDFNGLVCSSKTLDAPNPLADPAMAKFAQRFVDSIQTDRLPSTVLDARKAIYLLLPMGRATIEQVAQSMNCNVRTLQRRLQDEGETFSELINKVRRDLVVRYMYNSNYSLSRIADLLGYSMPSSFTRWFTSQFGKAPVEWRAENTAQDQDDVS